MTHLFALWWNVSAGRNNRTSVLEWGSLRGRGISTPDGESHRLTVASADLADPKEGRGVVVRGSDE